MAAASAKANAAPVAMRTARRRVPFVPAMAVPGPIRLCGVEVECGGRAVALIVVVSAAVERDAELVAALDAGAVVAQRRRSHRRQRARVLRDVVAVAARGRG